jgi:hypothetical protein
MMTIHIQYHHAMKTMLISLLFLLYAFVPDKGYSQDTVSQKVLNDRDELLRSCDGYLRGARNYTIAVNAFEIIGGSLFGIGLATEIGGLTAGGFLLGFGGMEMAKSIPIPLTKARRAFDSSATTWSDSLEFFRLRQKLVTAETLGYATMALTFGGQVLCIAAALSQDNNSSQTFFLVAGIACAIGSLGTSIGTSVMTNVARVELGKSIGSIGVGVGPQGVGAVYRLP